MWAFLIKHLVLLFIGHLLFNVTAWFMPYVTRKGKEVKQSHYSPGHAHMVPGV